MNGKMRSSPPPSTSSWPSPSSSSARRSLRRLPSPTPSSPMSPRQPRTTRDELLISLMASEAVVDCREFDILQTDEVEELKKEHQILGSRFGATSKKLTLETKIRDAAASLARAGAQTEQLSAANLRVEKAQKDFWVASEAFNAVNRRLMEHRAAVLSTSVRSMEKKISPHTSEDSGYDSSNRSTLMSPIASSVTSVSVSSKTRFDGAHLFAGHAESIVPKRKLSPDAAAAEISALEEKLREAQKALAEASQKQADLAHDLSTAQLVKQGIEAALTADLEAAEETLKRELPRIEELERELDELRGNHDDLLQRNQALESLQQQSGKTSGDLLQRARDSNDRRLEGKDTELQQLRQEWEAERNRWQEEREAMEDDRLEDVAHLQNELDREKEENEGMLRQLNDELTMSLSTLRAFIEKHGIVLFARDSSLQGLLNAVGVHIETVHTKLDSYAKAEAEWENTRRKLESEVRVGLDKQEALTRELEDVRRERDMAKRDTMASVDSRIRGSQHTRTPSIPQQPLPIPMGEPSDDPAVELQRYVSILQPLFATLPSPEARAAKFSNGRSLRTGSPNGATTPGSASVATSLSDLDVRSLKTLYNSGQHPPTTPVSPKPPAQFTIEAFVQRVQSLLNDDKALVERLLRFAQAHDLLKKNAERAQKLAQEGTAALETYQKQVRMLQDRNATLSERKNALEEELAIVHETVERIGSERRALEMRAVQQAEECKQLNEANNTLSAKTLSLAQEAAGVPEAKRRLEAQLSECQAKLEVAQDEVAALKSLEATQRLALLEELNSIQTENNNLRAQLRAAKK